MSNSIEPGSIWYGELTYRNMQYAKVISAVEPCGIRFELWWQGDPEPSFSPCWNRKKFLQEFRQEQPKFLIDR